MSRPKKLTLDFLIWDVRYRSDIKIRRLKKRHGNDGTMTFINLLCESAQHDGMILDLSDMGTVEVLADDFDLRDATHLLNIIQDMVEIGLLDRQLWESERHVFSKALYERYIARLEDRKQSAQRQQRKKEASDLQKRIDDVNKRENELITGTSTVFTRDNSLITRENPLNTEYRDQRSEYKDQKTEYTHKDLEIAQDEEWGGRDEEKKLTREECVGVVDYDPVKPDPTTVPSFEQRNVPRPIFASAAERCDRQFQPLPEWRDSRGPNGIKLDFAQWVAEVYYPEVVPSQKGNAATVAQAKKWITAREFTEQGIAEIELALDEFKRRVTPASTTVVKKYNPQQLERLNMVRRSVGGFMRDPNRLEAYLATVKIHDGFERYEILDSEDNPLPILQSA